jgi:ribosome-associated heat shock protein Hsp15
VCYGKNLMSDVRVDKWLWAARFFKSRTLAATACAGGKVDVNGDAVKPSKTVRPGDLLQITLPRGRRIVRIAELSERRGSGTDAQRLYEDLTPPPPPRESRSAPPAYRPPGTGRPTKRQRRHIDRLSRW